MPIIHRLPLMPIRHDPTHAARMPLGRLTKDGNARRAALFRKLAQELTPEDRKTNKARIASHLNHAVAVCHSPTTVKPGVAIIQPT